MDVASEQVARFLGALQSGRDFLVRSLYNRLINGGAQTAKPFLVLSGRPFRILSGGGERRFRGCVSLGLRATRKAGEPLEFSVDVLWDEDAWVVLTEVWADTPEGGAAPVLSRPERRADSLDELLRHLGEAVEELASYDHLISDG